MEELVWKILACLFNSSAPVRRLARPCYRFASYMKSLLPAAFLVLASMSLAVQCSTAQKIEITVLPHLRCMGT